ncbi:MAG: hypothetical protein PHV07_05625 [Oscillospiraceae bacterium]|nr:hypothetical protein [Oscillospiraceae bacterium]
MEIEKSYRGKNPKKKKLLVLLILFLIFCMVGFGIYALITFDSNTNTKINSSSNVSNTGESKLLDENGSAVDGAVQPKTPEEILDELKKAQINVTDKLSSNIFFPSGKSGTEGSWTVDNLESNNVIMQCEVYLDDRLIAKSVPIKPNQHIDNITLSEEIKPGLYDVIAYVNYFKLDTNEYISKAGFKIKLTVQ